MAPDNRLTNRWSDVTIPASEYELDWDFSSAQCAQGYHHLHAQLQQQLAQASNRMRYEPVWQLTPWCMILLQ